MVTQPMPSKSGHQTIFNFSQGETVMLSPVAKNLSATFLVAVAVGFFYLSHPVKAHAYADCYAAGQRYSNGACYNGKMCVDGTWVSGNNC
jgi:hypothetical protein